MENAHTTAWDAGLYNAKHDFVWKYGADVVALLNPNKGERILDLGCGTGHLSAQIAESGAEVVGVDRSAEMVAAARTAYPNLRFEVVDASELTFHDEFDAVFSNATLHWIREPERVLAGVARALRTGGRFVAELGGKGNVAIIQQAFDQALEELGAADRGQANPWYFPSPAEYATLAERHGFEVRYLSLFDRPTELADGAAGLRNWMEMFAGSYLEKAGVQHHDQYIAHVEALLRPKLFRDGVWRADYRRLRLAAYKL